MWSLYAWFFTEVSRNVFLSKSAKCLVSRMDSVKSYYMYVVFATN